MVLKKVEYFIEGKKKELIVKVCDNPWTKFSGLMFRKNSPPLLFIFNKEKILRIHSFFCKPFRAIWLDKNMNSTKVQDIIKWSPNFSGRGKYLIEIPLDYLKITNSRRKFNRNI